MSIAYLVKHFTSTRDARSGNARLRLSAVAASAAADAPLVYPGHFEVRLVSRNSGIRWKKHWVCVTHTLAGEYVGLEEVDDGLWAGYFGPVKLGPMNERILRIEDHKGARSGEGRH